MHPKQGVALFFHTLREADLSQMPRVAVPCFPEGQMDTTFSINRFALFHVRRQVFPLTRRSVAYFEPVVYLTSSLAMAVLRRSAIRMRQSSM
jgi:hypothetical protein